eukprot:2388499-Lingulodinium_polyedra.AAC.1
MSAVRSHASAVRSHASAVRMRTRFECERKARAAQTHLKIMVSKCVPSNSHMQMLMRVPFNMPGVVHNRIEAGGGWQPGQHVHAQMRWRH